MIARGLVRQQGGQNALRKACKGRGKKREEEVEAAAAKEVPDGGAAAPGEKRHGI